MANGNRTRRAPKRSSQSIGGVESTSGSTVVPSNNNQVKIKKGLTSKRNPRVINKKKARDLAKVTALKQTKAQKRSSLKNQKRTIAKTNVRKDLATPVGSRRALPSLFAGVQSRNAITQPNVGSIMPLPFTPGVKPAPFNDFLTRRLSGTLTPPVNPNVGQPDLRGGLPGSPTIPRGPQFTRPNVPPWFRR